MFHAQSANHSWPPQIRQAVIHDLAKLAIDDTDRCVHFLILVFVFSKKRIRRDISLGLYRTRRELRREALMADPWLEWSEELRAAGGGGKLTSNL